MDASEQSGVAVSLEELIQTRAFAERLRIRPRTPVSTRRAGGFVSRFRGRGLDFEEVRAYQPGDDIRAMDWPVTARTGRPHVKVFHEERERPVFFAVDQGPRMRFGTRVAFKSVVAARLAACLAWSAAGRGDRVGGVVFDEIQDEEFKPRGGHKGVLHFLHALARAPRQNSHQNSHERTRITSALARLRPLVRPGSLIFVLSDFAELDAEAEQRISELTVHSEVIALRVYDALEAELPPPGSYALSDGLHHLLLDTRDSALCAAYRARFAQRVAHLEALFRTWRVASFSVATHQNIYTALREELHALVRVS